MSAAPLATVGVVGCGSISDVYFSAISRSPALRLKSVAARGLDNARRQADRYGGEAVTFDAMLADPEIELIVNLTPSSQHLALNRRILQAGKHLYTEKPFALSLADARELGALADARAVRIGSAPDTFFGAAHQAARALVDQGAIGRPVHGAGFVGHPGIELFHPNPAGFYQPGSEPPYEIGPYYITQLVNLLGPVRTVVAQSAAGPDRRTIRRGPDEGESFPVDVPTSYAAILAFEQGAIVTLTLSLDVTRHWRRPIELYGTEGSLQLCDPNFFGGTPELSRGGGPWEAIDTSHRALGADNRQGLAGGRLADYRGIGIVEMVEAIARGRPHRTGPDLVIHCVEVMEAILRAAAGEGRVAITTRCTRPAPFERERDAAVLSLMRSPTRGLMVRSELSSQERRNHATRHLMTPPDRWRCSRTSGPMELPNSWTRKSRCSTVTTFVPGTAVAMRPARAIRSCAGASRVESTVSEFYFHGIMTEPASRVSRIVAKRAAGFDGGQRITAVRMTAGVPGPVLLDRGVAFGRG